MDEFNILFTREILWLDEVWWSEEEESIYAQKEKVKIKGWLLPFSVSFI